MLKLAKVIDVNSSAALPPTLYSALTSGITYFISRLLTKYADTIVMVIGAHL